VNFNFRPVSFTMALLVCFSSIALVLSMVGLYGVVSSVALLRRREVAVRLALGATPRQVRNLLAGHGVRLALPGALIGIVGAYFSARLLQSLLYGVGPHDLETFVLAPAILLVVSIAATYVPVRRAMHVDPAVVLRDE
jgi:putative ABC transport system permease protein